MANKKTSKKVPIIIAIMLVFIIVIILAGVFMSKKKAGESEETNDNSDIEESIILTIEQTVEYGDNPENKTFTIHTEDEEKEARFADLDPEVDTLTVGQTEHTLELNDDIFKVMVTVEDTQKPVLKGVKELFELEGEELDLEEALKKLITAEDPVDGELDVVFEIEKDQDKENNYHVTAKATDENGNKTTETFEVVVKVVAEEEKEEKADKQEDQSPPVASKSESDTSMPKQEEPKKEAPKQEKPKQEEPKQEKPKKEEPKIDEPKPESKPNEDSSLPTLGKPLSSVPSGASIKDSGPDYTEYSYTKNLPGGGKITQVAVSVPGPGRVSALIQGIDNNGNSFMGKKESSGATVSWMMSQPVFGNDDILEIDSVLTQFLKAYGR